MRALELKVPPLVVFALFAGAMGGAAMLWPGGSLVVPGARAIAVALAAAGLLIGAAGVRAFRSHGTTVDPRSPGKASTVVSAGIYRHTRNPMYLGLAVVLTGWATFLGHAAAFALVGAFVVVLDRFQIRPEERALSAKFGAAFDDYAAAVRRWI